MAYYNRREHLINTLNSILFQQYRGNVEIVIVDDASNEEHNIDDIPEMFNSLDIKLIKIKSKDKHWVNPCIPYNIGFAEASGDVIIIQNPECLHVGNIISTIRNTISENKYLVFGCYATNKKEFEEINNLPVTKKLTNNIKNIILPIKNRKAFNSTDSAWYQHSKYRPELLHFCTAITKKDLIELGGFDERFAHGIAKDDREFILRIQRKRMKIKMIDEPFVVHQFHKSTEYKPILTQINRNLYQVVKSEKKIKVNNSIK